MTGSQLIIFDCDGVLVDSEPLAVLAYERVYERHGMPGVGVDIISQCFGMKQADIIARIRELTGHQYPEHAPDDLWDETKALFTEHLQPTAGLPDFLSGLKIDRCVASSSSLERIHHSLDVTGIAPFFGEAIFSSSMVRHGKPAPDIFLFAAEKMGADPASCVVIEDSPFGVEGAVAAGMLAIGYTGGSHSYEGHGERLLSCGASAVSADWADVTAELEKRGFRLD
ncbi:HAD family hydrolase [Aquamicrobium ahrensii]|uniref:HAD superfamily hydrolase (TIGR01509 family) n=1 Tax=Aquamicrobium ahrensii TaxID=469551 RepID=A0ABV2KII3_9HYPH